MNFRPFDISCRLTHAQLHLQLLRAISIMQTKSFGKIGIMLCPFWEWKLLLKNEPLITAIEVSHLLMISSSRVTMFWTIPCGLRYLWSITSLNLATYPMSLSEAQTQCHVITIFSHSRHYPQYCFSTWEGNCWLSRESTTTWTWQIDHTACCCKSLIPRPTGYFLAMVDHWTPEKARYIQLSA